MCVCVETNAVRRKQKNPSADATEKINTIVTSSLGETSVVEAEGSLVAMVLNSAELPHLENGSLGTLVYILMFQTSASNSANRPAT